MSILRNAYVAMSSLVVEGPCPGRAGGLCRPLKDVSVFVLFYSRGNRLSKDKIHLKLSTDVHFQILHAVFKVGSIGYFQFHLNTA